MKKWLTLLLAGAVLTGCQSTTEEQSAEETEQTQESSSETKSSQSSETTSSNNENSSSEEMVEATAAINISVQGEDVASQEVTFEENEILLDVMDENFEMEYTSDGFVNSIEGHAQNEDEGLYWLFDVNGEMAPVGAGEYELSDGDQVEWTLEAM